MQPGGLVREVNELMVCRWDGPGGAPPTGPEDVSEQAGVCRPVGHQAALHLPAALPGHRQGATPPLHLLKPRLYPQFTPNHVRTTSIYKISIKYPSIYKISIYPFIYEVSIYKISIYEVTI